MPTFSDIEITTTVDIEFEVFCATCGDGLCNQSSTRSSRNRGAAQVEVNVCESCVESARQEIRDDLESQIKELQEQIRELEMQL